MIKLKTRINKTLTWLHRWPGFVLSLAFFITVTTGVITGSDDLIEALNNFGQSYQPVSLAQQSVALEQLVGDDHNYRQLVLPTPQTPFYQIRLRGERFTYRLSDLAEIDHQISDRNGFFAVVLRLHRNYLLGREGFLGIGGADYVAWVGLLSLLISLIALYLWWPRKKSFKWRELIPNGRKRKDFYYSHMTSGVVVLVAILLLAVTGAGITYRAITQQLLNVDTQSNQGFKTAPVYYTQGWLSWLETAQAQFPEAQLKTINPVRQRGNSPGLPDLSSALEFRFHTSSDWLGLAGSIVIIDRETSALLAVKPFADLSIGEKLYAMLLPLHTGRGLNTSYLIVLISFMTVTAIMVASGLISFLVKKRKYRKINQQLTDNLAIGGSVLSLRALLPNSLKPFMEYPVKQLFYVALVSIICSMASVYFFGASTSQAASSESVAGRDNSRNAMGHNTRDNNAGDNQARRAGGNGGQHSHGARNQQGQQRAQAGGNRGGHRQNQAGQSDAAGHSGNNRGRASNPSQNNGHDHSHDRNQGQTIAGFNPNALEASIQEMTLKLALNEDQQAAIRETLVNISEDSRNARRAWQNARSALGKLDPASADYERLRADHLAQTMRTFERLTLINLSAKEAIYAVLNDTQQQIVTNLNESR